MDKRSTMISSPTIISAFEMYATTGTFPMNKKLNIAIKERTALLGGLCTRLLITPGIPPFVQGRQPHLPINQMSDVVVGWPNPEPTPPGRVLDHGRCEYDGHNEPHQPARRQPTGPMDASGWLRLSWVPAAGSASLPGISYLHMCRNDRGSG
jgi:hypothetical protein